MKSLALVLSVMSLQAFANPAAHCQSSDIQGKASLSCINPVAGADLRFELSPQACVNGQITYPSVKGYVISPMTFIGAPSADQMKDFFGNDVSVSYEAQGTQVLPNAKMILPQSASFSDSEISVSIQFTKQTVKDGNGNSYTVAPFMIRNSRTGWPMAQGNLNCFSYVSDVQ